MDVIFHGLDEYEGMKCYSSIETLPEETLGDGGASLPVMFYITFLMRNGIVPNKQSLSVAILL